MLLATPWAPKPKPAAAEAAVRATSISFRTTRIWVALVTTVTSPWVPMSTASARTRPGLARMRASVLGRGPSITRRSLSCTLRRTGIIELSSRTPPPRNTSRSPKTEPARPPTTGPIAPPSATAEVTTPSAHPTRGRGVSAATSAVAAATVPLVAPCARRRTTSWYGFCAKKIRPTVIAPPSIERMSIGLRPNRSPSIPQIGLAMAIATPEALADTAVQRSRSRPAWTPRSCERKIERNGNAKLKPKIAVNSANHSAARLRFQSTDDGDAVSGKQFVDAVGRHRQVVDDGVGLHAADRVLDRRGDRGGHGDGAALSGALEALRVGVGRRVDVEQLRRRGDLAGADDRVVEEARRPQGAVRVVHRGLVERVAEPVREAAEQLALEGQRVDRLARVVNDDVAENLDLAGLPVDGDHRGVASAGEGERTGGVERLADGEALLGDDVGDGAAGRGRAPDRHAAVLEHDVVRVGLEDLGGAIEQHAPHRGRGLRGGVADLHGAPAPGGQQGEAHLRGVAGRDLDLFVRPAEPLRDDERRHRLVALALRRGADVDVRRTRPVDSDARRLAAAERRGLDAAGDADAHEPAVRLGARADRIDGHLEELRVVAAVVDDAVAPAGKSGRVRDLLGLDEVAPAVLDRVEAERARELVYRALHRVVAERPPAAADEAGRHRVGVDQHAFDAHGGQRVGRDHVRGDDPGLPGAGPGVRTDVVHEAAAQPAHLAVPARRDLELDRRPVRLRGGRAVLAAGRGPGGRPLQAVRGERD